MKEEIRNFIVGDILGQDSEFALEDDQDILAGGLIDSMGIVRLVGFIEEKFDLKIPPGDMVIDNFESINKIAEYIGKRG